MKRESTAHGAATIGRTTRVVGRVTGDGDLLVEGRIDGELTIKGHLHVASGGHVTSSVVHADEVTIEGGIDGDVQARGAVLLRAEARLRGGIHAGRIAVDDGARFSGRIEMDVELPSELTGESAPKRGRKG
jgi:cytoskeletal protein CcmA (bactofilin family)